MRTEEIKDFNSVTAASCFRVLNGVGAAGGSDASVTGGMFAAASRSNGAGDTACGGVETLGFDSLRAVSSFGAASGDTDKEFDTESVFSSFVVGNGDYK